MKTFVIVSCVVAIVVCKNVHESNHPYHIRRHSHSKNQTQEQPSHMNHTVASHKQPKSVEKYKELIESESELNRPAWPQRVPDGLQWLPALRYEEIHDQYGQYAQRFVTPENAVVSERGRFVLTKSGYVLEIEGKYQFIGDDGKFYVTKYRGGPDGFHVSGNHIPLPVPTV